MRLELEGKRPIKHFPVIMEMLSERYGWTPSQIRNELADDIHQYVEIISMKQKIEKNRRMRDKK